MGGVSDRVEVVYEEKSFKCISFNSTQYSHAINMNMEITLLLCKTHRFSSEFRNTSGSLGEREILWEHEPQARVSTLSLLELSQTFTSVSRTR